MSNLAGALRAFYYGLFGQREDFMCALTPVPMHAISKNKKSRSWKIRA